MKSKEIVEELFSPDCIRRFRAGDETVSVRCGPGRRVRDPPPRLAIGE